jgi:hypothetical protein
MDGTRHKIDDVVFTIRVEQHPIFTRRDVEKLFWEPEISFEDSVIGIVLDCPFFDTVLKIDTAQWGIIDPRKEYIFENIISKFNIRYPDPSVKYSLVL